MNTEMQNHIEKVQNDHKKMQNNHDETENNYLWMQNYYKEIQKDHRVWLKTIKRTHKMPTKRRWTTTETQNDDKQCILFPFGVGWHPPMYSKKGGGGVVYMSVPSSPLCHNPWLQQSQRDNQRWRCRNTLRAAWRKPDGYYTWAGSHTSRPAGTLLKPVYPEEEHLVVIQ